MPGSAPSETPFTILHSYQYFVASQILESVKLSNKTNHILPIVGFSHYALLQNLSFQFAFFTLLLPDIPYSTCVSMYMYVHLLHVYTNHPRKQIQLYA
jgi:hypothetical protein